MKSDPFEIRLRDGKTRIENCPKCNQPVIKLRKINDLLVLAHAECGMEFILLGDDKKNDVFLIPIDENNPNQYFTMKDVLFENVLLDLKAENQ